MRHTRECRRHGPLSRHPLRAELCTSWHAKRHLRGRRHRPSESASPSGRRKRVRGSRDGDTTPGSTEVRERALRGGVSSSASCMRSRQMSPGCMLSLPSPAVSTCGYKRAIVIQLDCDVVRQPMLKHSLDETRQRENDLRTHHVLFHSKCDAHAGMALIHQTAEPGHTLFRRRPGIWVTRCFALVPSGRPLAADRRASRRSRSDRGAATAGEAHQPNQARAHQRIGRRLRDHRGIAVETTPAAPHDGAAARPVARHEPHGTRRIALQPRARTDAGPASARHGRARHRRG